MQSTVLYNFVSLRSFVTGATVAQSPSKSRLVEAIIFKLADECVEQRAPYMSKWKVVLQQYNTLRHTVANSRVYRDTSMQLYPLNETTISKW